MEMQNLVGLKIVDARYDGTNIYLNTADGCVTLWPHVYCCCADGFIQHVSIAYALKDATVVSVEDVKGHRRDVDDYSVVDTFGHRITTDRGICSIEMRAEHNGYYSGSLQVSDPSPRASTAPILDDF